jgi:hypothetical protein
MKHELYFYFKLIFKKDKLSNINKKINNDNNLIIDVVFYNQ